MKILTSVRDFFSSHLNIKIMLSFVLVISFILLGTTVVTNRYITKFIKKEKIKYNSQVISTLFYDLDLLYNRITQFVNNYNTKTLDAKIYDMAKNGYDFKGLKGKVDFDYDVTNRIYINGLNNIVKDVLFYLDDETYYLVGDSALSQSFEFGEQEWFEQYIRYGEPFMVYGPIYETYRTENAAKEKIILFFGKMHINRIYSREYTTPFIMVSVRFSEMVKALDKMFQDNRGIVISDSNGEIIYKNNVPGEGMAYFDTHNIYQELISESNHDLTYMDKDVFITSKLIGNYGWTISTVDLIQEMFTDIKYLTRILNLIVILFGFIGIFLYHLSIKKLMMPIRKLYNLIDTMEETNDTYIEVNTKDEIGEISDRFNKMKKRLLELNSQVFLLEVREKEAQISALQSQINPHFLYNVLDNIYCIAQIEGINTIATLAYQLSNIMSYNIDNKNMYTTVTKEVDNAQAYIDIINVRYMNHITFQVKIDDEVEEAKTIKLLLQPIIENSWIHGILNKPSRKGVISLDIYKENQDLIVIVEDDGVGIDKDLLNEINRSLEAYNEQIRNSESSGMGVGLANVNDRIKLTYGENYGISVESEINMGTRLTIRQKFIVDEAFRMRK